MLSWQNVGWISQCYESLKTPRIRQAHDYKQNYLIFNIKLRKNPYNESDDVSNADHHISHNEAVKGRQS